MQKPQVTSTEIKNIEAIRAEVKDQLHHVKEDLTKRFHQLEEDWGKLSSHFGELKNTTQHASHEVTEATKLLVETIQEGYEQIKKSLH